MPALLKERLRASALGVLGALSVLCADGAHAGAVQSDPSLTTCSWAEQKVYVAYYTQTSGYGRLIVCMGHERERTEAGIIALEQYIESRVRSRVTIVMVLKLTD